MKERTLIIVSMLILLLGVIAGLLFNDCIGNDAAAYYVPMIEAFADGQYDYAFNPLIPPLVPFLSGVVAWLLPLSGFVALKLVSGIFVLLGLYPVYRLARRLMSSEHAQWACFLYAICSQVLRFGVTAQLTAAKFFFVLWLLHACINLYEKRGVRNVISMAFAYAGLALCRTEGFLYAPLCLASVLLPAILNRAQRRRELVLAIRNIGLTALICLAVWSPWITYEYKSTGYAVLDSRQIMIVEKLNTMTGLGSGHEEREKIAVEIETAKNTYAQSFGERFAETLDGFYIPYIPLVILGFSARFRRKQWTHYEIWVLSAVLFHVVMMWGASQFGGGPVLKRYIFPAALFLMPHSAFGWTLLRDGFADKVRSSGAKSAVQVVLAIIIVVSVGDGLKQVVDSFRGKYQVEKEMGLWISEHTEGLDRNVTPESVAMGNSEKAAIGTIKGQWRGRSLVVAAAFPQTACWAGAQHIKVERRQKKSMQELIDFCQGFGVDVLKVDKAIRRSTVDFDPNHPMLQPVESPWKGTDTELYLCVQ